MLLAAVALVIWVARPMWDEMLKLRAEKSAIEDALARLQDLQNLRDELLQTYNAIPKSKLDRLNDFLAPKPDSGNMLVMLEKLTRDRGIRLRRVEFSKSESQSVQPAASPTAAVILRKETAKTNTISYTMTISASYEAFRSFLVALEKNLRIIDVTDINFTGGSANLFEFTLKAKSYYQK